MNIAFLGPAYPYRGGLSDHSERLAKALIAQGHEVTLYTFTLQYPNFLFPGKSQYSEDPAPKHLKIIRCLNSINPLSWIKAGKKIRKANHDLLIVRYWLPFMGMSLGTALRVIKKNKKTKIIALVDNLIPHERRIGDKTLTKYFVKPVDAFMAMAKSVLDDIGKFDSSKPKTFSPHPLYDNFGLVTSKEEALKKLNIIDNPKLILFFGVIRDYKGLDILLKAYADKRFRDNNFKLVVAGEFYNNQDFYINLIDSLKLKEDILLVDKFIPTADVANYFNAADLVVQPYKTATQSGVAQIAYHFNKPMVVTDVGGLAEIVPDGKAGYVVDPEPKEIANAIFKFFEETNREKMIESLIIEKKKYSWEILTQNLFKLASEVPK